MQREFITNQAKETQKIGLLLAEEVLRTTFSQAAVICLSGELGAGKTTFTQGLLKGLKVKGPYTSPTFVIMKKYGKNIYHLDTYRVKAEDILNLGWEELLADKNNILVIEWADRIRKIIPRKSIWIKFEWLDKNKRSIAIK